MDPRCKCYKKFYGRNLQILVIKQVFVVGKLFEPSLMFAGKARAYPSEEPSYQDKLLALPTNIRLGCKSLPKKNALTYKFCNMDPRCKYYKTFYRRNLQIFVIKQVFVIGKLFEPSLMFAGKARAYPSEEPSFQDKLLSLPTNIRLGGKACRRQTL